MKPAISIIGQGAYGAALAQLYRGAGFETRLFGRDHPQHLDDAAVFLAVPTHAIAQVVSQITVGLETTLILCCKGFLPDGGLAMSLVGGARRCAVLSGPGFAHEIAAGLPTVHTLAASGGVAQALSEPLSTPSFRLYPSDDPVGVQVCGAYKNILAIAAGIADRLDLGENARAALISRGLAELAAGLHAFGGDARTVLSPAGAGDLVLTCTSPTSRNFRCGQRVGGGMPVAQAVAEIGVVEGVGALHGFLAKVGAGNAPIAGALCDVFTQRLTPQAALDALMSRPIKPQ